MTIAVVPRERYSATRESLESIYTYTSSQFDLVYVDGGSPPDVRRYLEEAARSRAFRLIRTDHVLTPNEARNLAVAEARGDYVVFIDNDVIVSPGWLSALVDCADETGAWVVGPLYLIGQPGTDIVHMAGGEAWFDRDNGRRIFREKHRHANQRLRAVKSTLRREPCDMVEFHCMLVRRSVFERLGPLDEGLMSANEHVDICLLVREAGGAVYFEPKSVVTYVPSSPLTAADRSFHLLRWSPEWNQRSLARFAEKWNVSLDEGSFKGQKSWLRRHRRDAYPFLKRLDRVLHPLWTRRVSRGRHDAAAETRHPKTT